MIDPYLEKKLVGVCSSLDCLALAISELRDLAWEADRWAHDATPPDKKINEVYPRAFSRLEREVATATHTLVGCTNRIKQQVRDVMKECL